MNQSGFDCKLRARAIATGALWLAAAGMLASPALAASNQIPSGCSIRSGVPCAAWVLADFDGDRKPDLAIAELPGLNGAAGSITVRSDGSGSFPLAAGLSTEVLRARDLDGDADWDLVLFSVEAGPIAVWLNDGAGHFERRDVAEFHYQLWHEDPRSLDSVLVFSVQRHTADHSRTNPGTIGCSGEFSFASASLSAILQRTSATGIRLLIRSRGPPSLL